MDKFDLKKYLVENKATFNSKILNEAVEGLPNWVESIEYSPYHGEVSLIVDKNWFNINKKKLENNIKDFWMFYSSKAENSIKNFPGYDPKQDYITDVGATIIDGKLVRTNSNDSLKNRTELANSWTDKITLQKSVLDIIDPKQKYYVKDIISDEDIKKIKDYAKEKYKKVITIYVEGK